MTESSNPELALPPEKPRSKLATIGRLAQRLLILTLVVGGLVLIAREAHERLVYVDEIDARISGDLVTVSSRVAGWLTE